MPDHPHMTLALALTLYEESQEALRHCKDCGLSEYVESYQKRLDFLDRVIVRLETKRGSVQ